MPSPRLTKALIVTGLVTGLPAAAFFALRGLPPTRLVIGAVLFGLAGGFAIAMETTTCADMFQTIMTRIYETAVKRVPDGYEMIDVLPEDILEIIASVAR